MLRKRFHQFLGPSTRVSSFNSAPKTPHTKAGPRERRIKEVEGKISIRRWQVACRFPCIEYHTVAESYALSVSTKSLLRMHYKEQVYTAVWIRWLHSLCIPSAPRMKLKLQPAPRPLVKTKRTSPLSDLRVLASLRLVRTGENVIGSEILHWKTAGQSSRNRTG